MQEKIIEFPYDDGKKKGMSTITKITIALVLLAVGLLVQFVLLPAVGFGGERDMRMENTGVGVSYAFDGGAAFHSYNSRNFFFVSRDGVRLISATDGLLQWNEAFVQNRPITSARGNFIAVGERERAMNLTVLSEEAGGRYYTVALDNPAIAFSVNETGFLSAIVEYEWRFMAYVFDARHTTTYEPFFGRPIFFADGLRHPTAVEVSHDGRFAAVAIVDTEIQLKTILEFRHTRFADIRDGTDGLFGALYLSGQMIMHMRFVSNDQLVVLTTQGLHSFRMGPAHSEWREIWHIPFSNQVSHISFLPEHVAIAKGDRVVGAEDSHPVGMVHIYSLSTGAVHGSYFMGRRVTHLSAGRGAFIVGADRNFQAVTPRGDTLWDFTTMHDTRDVIFVDDTNTILVAGNTRADIHRRRRFTGDEPTEVLY
jgi:hypothetical protein